MLYAGVEVYGGFMRGLAEIVLSISCLERACLLCLCKAGFRVLSHKPKT